jgi:hypothetical protein
MSEVVSLGDRYNFNRSTIEMLVDGFGPADWARRPSDDGGNTAHWIVGHVAVARRSVLRRLGEEIPPDDWEQAFEMKVTPAGTAGYPTPEVLLEDIRASGKLLTSILAEMTPEKAAEEWGSPFPDGGTTLADGAQFMHFHESYHIGQLGLLRRISGKKGLF